MTFRQGMHVRVQEIALQTTLIILFSSEQVEAIVFQTMADRRKKA